MAKNDKKIEFTSDYETNKKGEVKTFSKDISNIFIKLGVAQVYSEKEAKEKPVKTNKSKK